MNKRTDDTDAPVEPPADPSGQTSGTMDETKVAIAEGGDEPANGPAAADEPEVEPSGAGEAVDAPVRTGRSVVAAAVSGLALLLSLAARAGIGWLAWQSRDSGASAAGNEAAISALADRLSATRDSLGSLESTVESQLAQLRRSGEERSDNLAALRRALSETREQNTFLADRLAALETAVASLQGVSAGVRESWALAEAEYYLQIANAQLQLAGNPGNAALALEFADERLRELANPALSDVRRALSRELQALDAMERADLEGMALALSNLAERVDSLPLDEQVRRASTGNGSEAALDPDLSGWDRARASVKRAFAGIVSVRRTDEAATPLLPPDAAWFLRTNLALKLESARLALLKGEQAVFRQSLADATDWLQQYYDAGSRAVGSALETISDLRREGDAGSVPDISGSLQLLRQYRTLRNAGTSAASRGNADGASDEPAQ
ncbi:MAG: uroporphyrinogen-III C-methyltransferase [Woeseia sp.]